MHALQDTLLLFRRSVRHTFRSPEILVGITISPIMFVLMFRYVFGGAINIPGFDYVDFLMPGIFVQTLAFGALTTAISLAYDLEKGIVERFFTLPMSRSAIITGRTFADGLRAIFTVIVMVVVGVIVGYTPSGSAGEWLLAAAIMLIFCFAISWVGAIVALLVPNVEALQQITFIVILPLTFLSSAFVATETMPDGLRQFAENQPVTVVVDAVRALTNGMDPGNTVEIGLAWCFGILIVAMPTASLLFRRMGAR